MTGWISLAGAALGLLLGRHWLGGLLGAAIAWLLASGVWRLLLQPAKRSPVVVLFALLGRLAKADGRVCEREIALCEQLLRRLGLNARARRVAIQAFNEGKNPGHDLTPHFVLLRQLRAQAPMFLNVFAEMAFADGRLDPGERQLLNKYARMLGVREADLARVLDRYAGNAQAQTTGSRRRAPPPPPPKVEREDPYAELGVTQSANNDEIRRAFRQLISRHHPDKLAARGASPEQVRQAQERSQRIIAAYERIKSRRGLP